MWVTDVFLVVILALTGFCFIRTFAECMVAASSGDDTSSPEDASSPDASPPPRDWAGTPIMWHNNLSRPYTMDFGDKLYVFNPAAYRH